MRVFRHWLRPATLVLTAMLAAGGCALEHAASPMAAAPDACAVAARAHEDALMRLPFEIVNGRVYLQAQVNDRGPYTFAIDTGASGLGRADASLTSALGLEVTGETQTSDGVNIATVNRVHFDSLALGGLIREDFDVITRDYSSGLPDEAKIHGIVGRDFFADGLLVIDFPARSIAFSRTQALGADQAGVLAYERPFRVPVTIGAVSTTGNLDTGAGVTLVLPLSLYNQVASGPLEQAGRGQLTNTVIETSRTTLAGPVRIGNATVSNVEVRVSEQYPELLIGGQVLQNYVVAIDQRSRLVALCPPQR